MSTRVIRTAAALRPAGEWEQAIPLPAWGPVESAAPLRRPPQPQRRVYRAPAPRRRKRRFAGGLLRLAVLFLCVWALLRVLGAAKGALADLAPPPPPLSVPPALPPYAATPVQPHPFTSVN